MLRYEYCLIPCYGRLWDTGTGQPIWDDLANGTRKKRTESGYRPEMVIRESNMSKFLKTSVSGVATFGVILGLGLMAQTASAGCASGCHPPAPPSPPTHPQGPSMPNGGGNNWGGGGHGGGGGSSNNYNSNYNSNKNINNNSITNSVNAGSSVTISGGGYSNWSQTPGYPQTVGLNVETASEAPAVAETVETYTQTTDGSRYSHSSRTHRTKQVRHVKHHVTHARKSTARTVVRYVSRPSVTHSTRTITRTIYPAGYTGYEGQVVESNTTYSSGTNTNTVSAYGVSGSSVYGNATGTLIGLHLMAVEAACLDGSGASQPSVQLSGERMLDGGYSGEVYRCYGGMRLRIRMAPSDGHSVNFSSARFLSCDRGESLWHNRGVLSCGGERGRVNERDLMQRYGTGVKIINVAVSERSQPIRQMDPGMLPPPPVAAPSRGCNCSTNMVFDGGVGGFVQ